METNTEKNATSAETGQVQELSKVFAPVIEKHGLVLESLDVKKRGSATLLDVVVDLHEDEIGSADLDTVTDVSRELSDLLDADASLIGEGPSTLEVTTPGVFRPLTEIRHFKRARTRLLDIIDTSGRTFLGRLEGVEGDELVFEVQKPPHVPKKAAKAQSGDKVPPGPHRVPVSDVAQAEIHLEFR